MVLYSLPVFLQVALNSPCARVAQQQPGPRAQRDEPAVWARDRYRHRVGGDDPKLADISRKKVQTVTTAFGLDGSRPSSHCETGLPHASRPHALLLVALPAYGSICVLLPVSAPVA